MTIQNNKAASGGGEFSTSAPEVPVLAHYKFEPNEPEFYSMPSVGQTCNGLRRGALYCLWRDGEIETISVRRKGRARGRRLIVGDSLRKYLRRLREEQNPSGKEGAK
ncbi:MAG: hypothetical protein ACR2MF_10325 [Chthoniobacterales bacterium]